MRSFLYACVASEDQRERSVAAQTMKVDRHLTIRDGVNIAFSMTL